MAAIFGVVYGAIALSKDSKVKSDADPVLVTPDEKSVIQMVNADIYVSPDGSLLARHANMTFSSDNADAGALKVASVALNTVAAVSSDLPDEVFDELKNIRITSSLGATMNLNILGMVRMPPYSPNHLGAVTLLTHIGRIVIDGATVSYFDDTQAVLFEASGFRLPSIAASDGRRLLDGVSALVGSFNAAPVVNS